MNIFTQFFSKRQSSDSVKQDINRELLRRESSVGKHVFGPIPKGHNREFFRIDAHTWIWQETWVEGGQKHNKHTKYLIREKEMVKSVNSGTYQRLSIKEAKNLTIAISEYVKRVKIEVYNVQASQ